MTPLLIHSLGKVYLAYWSGWSVTKTQSFIKLSPVHPLKLNRRTFFNIAIDLSKKFVLINVCLEKGLLLSFIYKFGQVACRRCYLSLSYIILAQLACSLIDIMFCLHSE
jgi:hypothetical protein